MKIYTAIVTTTLVIAGLFGISATLTFIDKTAWYTFALGILLTMGIIGGVIGCIACWIWAFSSDE